MSQIKTATVIDQLDDFRGFAVLYRCDPPLETYDAGPAKFVIASSVTGFATETYLFPSDEDGKVVSWCEMPGSQKGTVTHEQVFEDLGYEVVTK